MYGDAVTDTKVDITKPRVNLGRAINSMQNVDAPEVIKLVKTEWAKVVNIVNGQPKVTVFGKPKATGQFNIVMEVQPLEHVSDAEYHFQYVEDGNTVWQDCVPGIWQDETICHMTSLKPNTVYRFRVLGRDKSGQNDEILWSSIGSATTANFVDNKSPWPDPAQWQMYLGK